MYADAYIKLVLTFVPDVCGKLAKNGQDEKIFDQ